MVEAVPPVGVITGPGLYKFFTHFYDPKRKKRIPFEERMVHTPFGVCYCRAGRIYGLDTYLISRHGDRESPERRPRYRANMWALASLGVKRIISTSTGRSLAKHIIPGNAVLPDQYLDLSGQMHSFHGRPKIMDEPFCPDLRSIANSVGNGVGMLMINKGVYAGITGPSFETEAEAKMIAKFGGEVVGTSVVPEVKLAREMALCYQAVVLITRYEEFSADIDQFEKGVLKVKSLEEDVIKLIMGIIAYIPRMKTCHCWER